MMIRIKRFLLLAMNITLVQALPASDSLSVAGRSELMSGGIYAMQSLIWENPALMQAYSSSSLSDVGAVIYNKAYGKASMAQSGSGDYGFLVSADSYYRLNDEAVVYGSAGYENRLSSDLLWNESSDYDLIYPYVTGDSISGNLYSEIYTFSGGYASVTGKMNWGIEMAYRAQVDYGRTDPRQKNIVSDMQLKAGVAFSLDENYLLGAGVLWGDYDQKSDISFYGDLGSTSVYHLTGLGMDYVRFAGDKTSSKYESFIYSLMLNLLPRNHKGVLASIKYSRRSLDKKLSALNNLTLNTLTVAAVEMELGLISRFRNLNLGVMGSFSYSDRNGRDNIFGDATNSVYPLLSSQNQYENPVTEVELKASVDNKRSDERVKWSLEPRLSFYDFSEIHKESLRENSFRNYSAQMQGSLKREFKKISLGISAALRYTKNLDQTLILGSLDPSSSRYQMLLHNHLYQSADCNDYKISLQGEWNADFRHQYWADVSFSVRDYSFGNSELLGVRFGMKF